MLGKELKKSLIEINKNKFSYLFLFIQFVYFSGLIKQFSTDVFLFSNLIFTLGLCLYKKRLTNNNIYYIVVITLVFILINIIPSAKWGLDPKPLLGYLGRLILGALIVIYFKHNFFQVFENLVFMLALLSLPLFIIQLAYVNFFDVFKSFSEAVLIEERLNFGQYVLTGHRYLLVFLVNSWGELRNSGFMWEPAAFGAMLTWAIIYNLFLNKFTINSRLIVLIIAAVTTFSIGTFSYLFLLLIIYLIQVSSIKRVLGVILSMLIMFTVLYQFEFVQNNIEMISNKIEMEEAMTDNILLGETPEKTSRVGGFFANIRPIAQEPLGHGIRYGTLQDVSYLTKTPNGLMVLLRNWGVFALVLIIFCLYKKTEKLQKIYSIKLNKLNKMLFLLVFILPIFGNPFSNQPMFLAVLLSGFFVEKKLTKAKEQVINIF